jgi:hypothetical protein
MVSYAAENTNAGVLELIAANNTFVNEDPNPGTDATFLRMRQGTKATVVNNIMAGPGSPWTTEGVTVVQSHNYIDATRNNTARLADPASYDYHLLPDSPCRDAGVAPDPVDGVSLTPQFQYVVDAQSAARVTVGTIDIGAFEYQPTATDLSYFPQVVVGGGYSTVFSITNVGAETAIGNLVLTDDEGTPALAVLTPAAPGAARAATAGEERAAGSSFPLSIPAGGSAVLTAGDSISTPVRKGWAKIESSGGTLAGSATFQLRDGTRLADAVGVLGTRPTASATIPVDNDEAGSRFVGFALANPDGVGVNITVTIFDEGGNQLDSITPPELNPLGSGKQVARFLHEYQPTRTTFRGSMVLRSSGGRQFVVVALVLNQGRFTAVPTAAGAERQSPVLR